MCIEQFCLFKKKKNTSFDYIKVLFLPSQERVEGVQICINLKHI